MHIDHFPSSSLNNQHWQLQIHMRHWWRLKTVTELGIFPSTCRSHLNPHNSITFFQNKHEKKTVTASGWWKGFSFSITNISMDTCHKSALILYHFVVYRCWYWNNVKKKKTVHMKQSPMLVFPQVLKCLNKLPPQEKWERDGGIAMFSSAPSGVNRF